MNLKFSEKTFQKPAQNWENSGSFLSAPEISLDAPMRIESESKFLNCSTVVAKIAVWVYLVSPAACSGTLEASLTIFSLRGGWSVTAAASIVVVVTLVGSFSWECFSIPGPPVSPPAAGAAATSSLEGSSSRLVAQDEEEEDKTSSLPAAQT